MNILIGFLWGFLVSVLDISLALIGIYISTIVFDHFSDWLNKAEKRRDL